MLAKVHFFFDIAIYEAKKCTKSGIAQIGVPLGSKRYAYLLQEV